MKISIAMCTYQGEHYLCEQLQSFLDQILPPDELVVCDDGSSDRTLALLQQFAQDAPFAVRIIRNATNLGSTRNFVQAIALCRGEYIALCDQDDVWRPEKLAVLTQVLDGDPSVSAVFSDGDLIDGDSAPLGRTLWESAEFTESVQRRLDRGEAIDILKKQYFVTGAALMLRAEARGALGETPTEWVHDAWIAWKLAIYGKLASTPARLIAYRVHAGNQVGVNTLSWWGTLRRRDAAKVQAVLSKEMRNFELLRDAVATGGQEHSEQEVVALQRIKGRLRFLHRRHRLVQRSRLLRPIFGLLLFQDYGVYSKGWRSLFADLVL